jgi:hypothetical protein
MLHAATKIISKNPLRVIFTNGETMDSTHTSSLEIPELSEAASVAQVFTDMENYSLLSVGQMCNEGYCFTFRIDGVKIYNSAGKAAFKRQWDFHMGSWRINLRSDKHHPTSAAANKVYELRNTGGLVNYLHKAMFSPTKSALLQGVKKGLTEAAINKNLKMTPATAMGRMNQRHQNICSTTKNEITSDLEYETVTPSGLGTNTHLVCAVVIDQEQLYTDLTGRLPVISSKGIWYVMVCYSYDCNYMKSVPMKSRSASEWLTYYGGIHQELTSKRFKPKLQTLDN